MIVELGGVRPTIGEDVWLAPTAVLVGDVRVGDRASIWFGAVLRGDSSSIAIGAGSSVQDNAVIHCAGDLPTVVGEGVIVGHAAMLEGCVIEDGAVVGMGAIVLQRARLGAGSMLAAGAVLSEAEPSVRACSPRASPPWRRSRCRARRAAGARPPPPSTRSTAAVT